MIPKHKPTLLVLASTYPRWADDPEPGFVHELAKRLVAQFDVIVVCPHAKDARTVERMDGVEIVRYRYAPESLETLVNDGGIVTNLRRSKWKLLLVPGFVIAQAWQAWRLVRSRRVDLVHAHWLIPQGLIVLVLQRLARCSLPYLVTAHGADVYALKGRMVDVMKRRVLAAASAVTVVSSAMREPLRMLGADMSKVSVISMGVDVAGRFVPDASIERADDEILFVGRLVEKKGVACLIRALPEVFSRRPDAFLSIAGFGPEEGALRSLVTELGLADRVFFLGALPQAALPALYRRAAVFVAPFVEADSGDREGLPVVLMEAVACGCPIVAGDVPGVADLLGDMTAEVAVNARDVAALASAVTEALTYPERARDRATRIRDVAARRVDWNVIAERYARVLASVTDAGGEDQSSA